MKNLHLATLFALFLSPTLLTAQIHFIKNTRLLSPAQHFSGVVMGTADMNGDGYDDLVRLDKGINLAIDFQQATQYPFTRRIIGQADVESQWGMCIGDLNNDGLPEVLTGGPYDGIKIASRNPLSGAYSIKQLSVPAIFLQTANFADINNDGWLDAFLCHDDSTSLILGNNGIGTLTHQEKWINLDAVWYTAAFNSGNYGSIWTDVDNDNDLDLYIAKCRQGINDPTDPRRINQLFWNNGDGTYTQDTLGIAGLRIGAQSWTADFGDIDNDGDFDCFITNHDVTSQLLENDGKGIFTDITTDAGLHDQITGLPIQGVMRDFDNDGYLDIIVVGTRQHLFHNNQDKTFTEVIGQFDGKNQMESYTIGDYNHDGFLDVYGGYAKIFTDPSSIPDALWMNAGNTNHYLGVRLIGSVSNRSAIGAKVFLHNALGTQVREVRSGESYGISNSQLLLFGLGNTQQIDSIVVHWPAGGHEVFKQPAPDQYFTVIENTCALPAQHLQASAPLTFCLGDSTLLTAPIGFSHYRWNTGDTTRQITVRTSGNYSAALTLAPGCTVHSDIIGVTVNPNEKPLILPSSATTFCEGSSITLSTTRPYAQYLWSTGDTTATTEARVKGSYTLTVQGLCETFTSDPFPVNVLDAPEPTTIGDTVLLNEMATLRASSPAARWYDSPIGGDPFFTGNLWTTLPLTATDTFWVDAVTTYDTPDQNTGMPGHAGTSFGDTQFNGAIIFDCLKPFRLANVLVTTNTAGQRRIVLQNDKGQELQGRTVTIPTGLSVVQLGFDIPVGEDLRLTTDTTTNLQSFNTRGPRLRRSDLNVNYPYTIPDVVTIKGSNFDENRYYYFFKWTVDYYPWECVSDRVPVIALLNTGSAATEPPFAAGLRFFPNPTDGGLTGRVEDFPGGKMGVRVKNSLGSVLLSEQLSLPAGQATWQTDLQHLPTGSYWIELTHEQGIVQRKVVVQR